MARDKRATEFGGIPGRIAPLPHEWTAAEEARLQRASNPAVDDEGSVDTPEAVLIREWEKEKRL